MNRIYSHMIQKIIQQKETNNKYEDIRILKIDPEIENFNIYTDSDFLSNPYDDGEADNGYGGDADVDYDQEGYACETVRNNLENDFEEPNVPFPQFLYPLFTLFSRELNDSLWVKKKTDQLKCLAQDIKNTDYHPCDHKNSSCVIVALPNQRILVGCMNSKTGELIPPKNFDGTEQELPFLDFEVTTPLKLDRQCKNDEIDQPICQRTNLFYKERLIIEDTSCCCKNNLCVNVIFDQHGEENLLPYIHIEMDENDYINQPTLLPKTTTIPETTTIDEELQQQQIAEAQTWSGFDWNFSPIETFVIICVVLLILIMVIILGLWYVHEKEQVQDFRTNAQIQRTTDVFDLESDSDLIFDAKNAGRNLN
uniref:Uncharacterized protein n=1 Tax=Panagrolaimus sp. JU765 TaxID=591449 RepID=A0AC34QXA0_9BILA